MTKVENKTPAKAEKEEQKVPEVSEEPTAAVDPVEEEDLEEAPDEEEPKEEKTEVRVKEADPNAKPSKVTLADMEDFKVCIAAISELISEATIVLDKQGFSIIAMDPANVAMVIYKAAPSAFSTYNVEEENKYCINLNNFKQFLKRGSKETILELTFTEKVSVRMTNGSKIKTFTLPVIETDGAAIANIPDLQHNATVKMKTTEFVDMLADADTVAESIVFSVKPEEMKAESKGDLSTYKNENIECSIDCKENCTSKFALEYLKKMVNAKLSKDITMKLNTEYPLVLESETKTAGKIIWILAPRVEND